MLPNSYKEDIATSLMGVFCAICGQELRVPMSVERGIGPECDNKVFGGGATESAAARAMALFDEKLAAETIEGAPNVPPPEWGDPIRVASEGDELPDGTIAKEGEVLEWRPIRMPGLRDYLRSKDPREEWRTDLQARLNLISKALWYASRAVTFGFGQQQVSAQKVDPAHEVVATCQRLARAFGLESCAYSMTHFYSARMLTLVQERVKDDLELQKARAEAIIFERVPATYWPSGTRKEVGPGAMRVHAPYNTKYTEKARSLRSVFFAFENDDPYFWRYFRVKDMASVVNVLSAVYGDRKCVSRDMVTASQRKTETSRKNLVLIADVETGEVRYFPPDVAAKFKGSKRFRKVE
jgi:hypothetical protein